MTESRDPGHPSYWIRPPLHFALLFTLLAGALACGAVPQAQSAAPELPLAASSTPRAHPPQWSSDAPPRSCVQFDAGFEGEATMGVSISIPPALVPEGGGALTLRFRPSVYGRGYAQRYALRVDEHGTKTAWDPTVPLSPDGARAGLLLDLSYHAKSPRHGAHHHSAPIPAGWHLQGRSFIPDLLLDGEPWIVPVCLRLRGPGEPGAPEDPVAQSIVSSAPGSQGSYHGPDFRRLANATWLLGGFDERSRVVALSGGRSISVTVASPDWSAATLDSVMALARRALQEGDRLLGPPDTDRVLITGLLGAQHTLGMNNGGGMLIRSPDHPHGTATTPVGYVIVHELMHNWSPGSRVVRPLWMREGFTDALAIKVASAVDEIPAQVADRGWWRLLRLAISTGKGLRIADARGARAYQAGAALAYCLEPALPGGDFVALFRRARAAFGPDETFSAYDLADLVQDEAPMAADALRTWPEAVDALDLEGCLAGHGLREQEEVFRGIEGRSLAVEVLGATSFTFSSKEQGFVVRRPRPGSIFQAKDLLRRVNGTWVAHLADVDWALRDVPPGEGVNLEVLRGGALLELRLDMPEVDALARTKNRYLRLVPLAHRPLESP